MAISTFDVDVENISALSDQPNDNDGLSASELKAKFDKAGKDLKSYINNTMLPELEDAIAAAAQGVAFDGLNGEFIIDGTVTDDKLSSTEGSEAVTSDVIREYAVTFAKLSLALQELLTGHTNSISTINTTLATKANTSSLADVATSGSYTDLSNAPTIPIVDDSVIADSTNALQSVLVQQLVAAKANTNHASDADTYGLGTNSLYGHVQLSDAVNSTSSQASSVAATPAAVKTAYDLAYSKQAKAKTETATLTSGTHSWTNIAVDGVTASNNVICTPDPTSYAQWVDNRVRCSGQSNGTLTFTGDTDTTEAITVNILILD